MTRTDTKYLCPIGQLQVLLKKARSGFRVLEILGNRIPGYESLYLDTPEHRMYLDHHNGKLNRYKIRIREYLTTKEVFLEIKLKDNHLCTEKKRIPIPSGRDFLKPEYKNFISSNTPFDPESLEPKLMSSFNRITLVNNGERIIEFPHVVIIEVKSVKTTSCSGFNYLLREERILPDRLSKYCTGTAFLYPEIKHNRFKAKLLHLKKLNNSITHDQPSYVIG